MTLHRAAREPRSPSPSNDRRVPRAAVTPAGVLLVAVALGIVAMVAFRFRPGREESPLTLLQLAPGMTRRDLERTVSHAPGGSVSCRRFTAHFQYCVVKLPASGDDVFALVDERQHVAAIQLHQLTGTDALRAEAERVTALWDRQAGRTPSVPHVDRGDTGATRWLTRDGRWSAAMHYRGLFDPDVPMMLIVADERALARLVAESADAAENAKHFEFVDPAPDEAANAYERRQSDRASEWRDCRWALVMLRDHQTAYYNAHRTFAADLQQLTGIFIVGASQLEILSASDSGWSARATHPRFPGRSCVTYAGRVPTIPQTAMGTAITSAEGIACDTVPAEPRPSMGQGQ